MRKGRRVLAAAITDNLEFLVSWLESSTKHQLGVQRFMALLFTNACVRAQGTGKG